MTISSLFDALLERVSVGERLDANELTQLAETPDILQLGMLADTVRRRIHGAQVTYVRVALCPFDRPFTGAVPLAAREVRVTGNPDSLEVAATAVETARAVAGHRTVSAFSWLDVERLAALVQRFGKKHLGHPARTEAGAKQVPTEAPRGDLDGFVRRHRCEELTRAKVCRR